MRPISLLSTSRQHCRLSICEYWLIWTVSEQKISITILILKQGPCPSNSTQKPWGKPSSPSSTIIVRIIISLIMVIKPCPESVQTVLSKWPLLSSSSAPFSNSYPPQHTGHGQQFYTCSPLNSEQDFTLNYFTPSLSDHCLALSAICCINFTHMTFRTTSF